MERTLAASSGYSGKQRWCVEAVGAEQDAEQEGEQGFERKRAYIRGE